MKRFGTVVCFLSLASLLASGAGAASSKPTPGRRAAAAKARAAAIHLNRNLIVNGGAELSEEGWASGWEPAHALESEGYGHTAGEWDAGVTGAPQAGERYFRLPVPDGQEAIEF